MSKEILKSEVMRQLNYIKECADKFVTAVSRLKYHNRLPD